jgi:hypothetical protein
MYCGFRHIGALSQASLKSPITFPSAATVFEEQALLLCWWPFMGSMCRDRLAAIAYKCITSV